MRSVITVLLAVVALFTIGCRPSLHHVEASSSSSNADSIDIVLLDAQGLQGGEHVYVRGVLVGETAVPRLVKDRAVVSVHLNGRTKPEDIVRCTVFGVNLDRTAKTKLRLDGRGPDDPETSGNFCFDNGYLGVTNEALNAIRNGGDVAIEVADVLNALSRHLEARPAAGASPQPQQD